MSGAGQEDGGFRNHRAAFAMGAADRLAIKNSFTISTNSAPFSSGARCLAPATVRATQWGRCRAR